VNGFGETVFQLLSLVFEPFVGSENICRQPPIPASVPAARDPMTARLVGRFIPERRRKLIKEWSMLKRILVSLSVSGEATIDAVRPILIENPSSHSFEAR
jgi:hypothetical protein